MLRDVRDVRSLLPISGPFPGIFPTNLKEARSYEYQAQDAQILRILPSGTKGAYVSGERSASVSVSVTQRLGKDCSAAAWQLQYGNSVLQCLIINSVHDYSIIYTHFYAL